MRTGSSTCVLSCCDDFLLFGEADSGFDPGFDSVVFTPSIRRFFDSVCRPSILGKRSFARSESHGHCVVSYVVRVPTHPRLVS